MKKDVIIPKDTEHLKELIEKEMLEYGDTCDLNHIDVSKITDMFGMFRHSQFNGEISQWDVSNVTNMSYMFSNSKFSGDISNWNVSNVERMFGMFRHSQFNNDISNWDVSSVEQMNHMFQSSEFNGDLNNWKPLSLQYNGNIFLNSRVMFLPFWAKFDDDELKAGAVKKHLDKLKLEKKLSNELENKKDDYKKIKI